MTMEKTIEEIKDYVFDWCELNGERQAQKTVGFVTLTREANTRSYIGTESSPYMIPILSGVSSDSTYRIAYAIIQGLEAIDAVQAERARAAKLVKTLEAPVSYTHLTLPTNREV